MASFVPPIRSRPSSLAQGKFEIRVVVDQKSIEAAAKGIDQSVRASAKGLALHLSEVGIQFLQKADQGAGHDYLASQWTNTRPAESGGVVRVDVFNAAEDETIYTRSNAPGSNSQYPISGKRLLNILLNGAKAHPIEARDDENPLAFPIVRGRRQSRFAGTYRRDAGVAIARYTNRQRFNDLFFGWRVNHPGVTPNRFLQAAKQAIEQVASAQGPEVAGRVAASVAAGKIGTTF